MWHGPQPQDRGFPGGAWRREFIAIVCGRVTSRSAALPRGTDRGVANNESKLRVFVIPTDEEMMIVSETRTVLA